MARKPATERIFPPLLVVMEGLTVEDEEITSNFSEFKPDFDVICNVVSILPIEYDMVSEVNEDEEDFTKEMAIHKTIYYYIMNNGCVEEHQAMFERPDLKMKSHLQPLFIQEKVNNIRINKVLVDGGATVNWLTHSLLKKIGKI